MHQFAYVTDGACTEEEILSMEVIVMKVNTLHLLHLIRLINTEVTAVHFLLLSYKGRSLPAAGAVVGVAFPS